MSSISSFLPIGGNSRASFSLRNNPYSPILVIRSQIEADLNSGTTLICDRYSFSGCAFTAAKGLDYNWSYAPETGLPAPDIVLFLDVSPDVAKARGGYGVERYEKEDMQRHVRDVFQRLGKDFGPRWHVVDADQTLKQVEKDVWATVKQLVESEATNFTRL